MGWFDDLGGALKKGAKNVGHGVDKATDVVIDKNAWSRAMPGGQPLRKQDVANMVLDSTILIPGAGLAGGAARVAARTAAKRGIETGAKSVEKKLLADSLRSGPNKALRGKAEEMTAKLTGKVDTKAGKLLDDAVAPAKRQVGRMAKKQEAGIGKKVGFGQTKKQILKTAALTGGANAAARAYDNGGFNFGQPSQGNVKEAAGQGATGGAMIGMGSGGGLYLTGSDGSSVALPADLQKALASFMNQGGSPDGAQVVHLGR